MLSNLQNSYTHIKYIISHQICYDILSSIINICFDLIHQDIYRITHNEVIRICSKPYDTIDHIVKIYNEIKHIGIYNILGYNIMCCKCNQKIDKVIAIRSDTDHHCNLPYCDLHFKQTYDKCQLFYRFILRYYPE